MKTAIAACALACAGLIVLGCPSGPEVLPDDALGAGQVDGGSGQDAGELSGPDREARPPLEKTERPVFDPDAPAPCASHTACYLAAKKAHASGERAGYMLTVEQCEYYRGRYQLEKFYGLCLLMLGDAYRHLNNFEESRNCYRRFLDMGADEPELSLQARASLEEVEQGAKTPFAYRDYLEALSLLTRFGHSQQRAQLDGAAGLLEKLQQQQPVWPLAEKVSFLLDQIAEVRKSMQAGNGQATDEGSGEEHTGDEGASEPAPDES
ncbi:MAG: hypothetical protein JXR96_13070 [Deltaproteobacteria bacterium]|nr:hypothetical protein [Deltaproteobacteria bacterium]